MHGEDSAHARDRIFASRTASLRRADSLKSVGDRKACVVLYFSLLGGRNDYDVSKTPTQGGCVPTVPATPIPAPRKARRKTAASARPLRDPVPIIAPPHDYIPKLPLSAETLAKIRLGKFLDREGRGREKDGLPMSGWDCPPVSWSVDSDSEDEEQFGVQENLIEWEVALGIGQRARQEVIDWILDVRLFSTYPLYFQRLNILYLRHRSCQPHPPQKMIPWHHRFLPRCQAPLLRLIVAHRLHRVPRFICSPRISWTS